MSTALRIAPWLAMAALAVCPPVRLSAQCPDGAPPPCRGAAGAPESRVAVLSFENRSRDTADAFLAEGLADEIANRLGQIGRLSVISRSQVRRLPGAGAMAIPAVGRALNAGTLVTGFVQGNAGRLRVQVELLRASNAVQLWSNVYDRSRTDMLDIQSDLATQVAQAIAGTLRPGERVLLARAPTRDAKALEHLMRGNILALRRNTNSLERAIAEYQAAARLDPGSATIQARLSIAYGLCAIWEYRCLGLGRDSLRALAAAPAALALRLDSTVTDTWQAQAQLLATRAVPDFVAGYRSMERALALDSNSADAWHTMGVIHSFAGEFDESVRKLRQALRIDPTRSTSYEILARVFIARRDLDGALLMLDSATLLDPAYAVPYHWRATMAAWRGDTATAVREAESWVRTDSGVTPRARVMGIRAFALAAAGELPRANALTDSLLADSTGWSDDLWLAMWRLGRIEEYWRIRGDAPPAIRYHLMWKVLLPSPWFDPIRGDPRLQRLTAAMGVHITLRR